MTTFAVVGSGSAYADPAQVTRGSGATAGNLLIAIVSDRSGTSQTNHTVTDTTSNSGDWTKRVGVDNAIGDAFSRCTLSVWSRVANGDDSGSFTVTGDDGTSNSKRLTVLEIQPSASYGFDFEVQAAAGSGTSNLDGTSSGNTSDLGGSDLFELAVAGWRTGSAAGGSFATQTDDNAAFNITSSSVTHLIAIEAAGQTGGAKSATVTVTGSNGPGAVSVLVFSAGGADPNIAATGALSFGSSANVSATGALAATGAIVWTPIADLTAPGALAATGALTATAATAFAGSADLTTPQDLIARGDIIISSAALLTATGTLSATSAMALTGSAALTDANAVAVEWAELGFSLTSRHGFSLTSRHGFSLTDRYGIR